MCWRETTDDVRSFPYRGLKGSMAPPAFVRCRDSLDSLETAETMVRPLATLPGWPSAELRLRLVEAKDVKICAELEAASYPSDEAASPENLALRQRVAGDYFWAAVDKDDSLVGFVCGTRAHGTSLTHVSMEKHEPEGRLLCVHSVVTKECFRRRGVALEMLREYLRAVAALPPGARPEACALIAKAGLVSLYAKAGFQLLGLSSVVHGADPWFELQVPDLVRSAFTEPLVQCDAFTAEAGTGNAAAVVFSQRKGDAKWMQKVAAENNLSETAFVELLHSKDESSQRFSLRWFTPTCEVDLCGHATLGAAHALWSTGRASKRRRIDFETKASGVLSCELSETGWIQLDFPADPPNMSDTIKPSLPHEDELSKALGLQPGSVRSVGRGRFDILCEVEPREFDAMKPDSSKLAEFACRGVCVTTAGCGSDAWEAKRANQAAAPAKIDFRSRFFAPRAGLAEDPVTGSAHCLLAPYWALRLGKDPNGAELVGFQASARGGVVKCRLGNGRVMLSGLATTTLEGGIYCG